MLGFRPHHLRVVECWSFHPTTSFQQLTGFDLSQRSTLLSALLNWFEWINALQQNFWHLESKRMENGGPQLARMEKDSGRNGKVKNERRNEKWRNASERSAIGKWKKNENNGKDLSGKKIWNVLFEQQMIQSALRCSLGNGTIEMDEFLRLMARKARKTEAEEYELRRVFRVKEYCIRSHRLSPRILLMLRLMNLLFHLRYNEFQISSFPVWLIRLHQCQIMNNYHPKRISINK